MPDPVTPVNADELERTIREAICHVESQIADLQEERVKVNERVRDLKADLSRLRRLLPRKGRA